MCSKDMTKLNNLLNIYVFNIYNVCIILNACKLKHAVHGLSRSWIQHSD